MCLGFSLPPTPPSSTTSDNEGNVSPDHNPSSPSRHMRQQQHQQSGTTRLFISSNNSTPSASNRQPIQTPLISSQPVSMDRKQWLIHPRFVIFSVVKIQVKVFWVVMLCGVAVGYQHFGGSCCNHLYGEVKMVAARFSTSRVVSYIQLNFANQQKWYTYFTCNIT
jgi:hypothetical protein